MFWPYFEGTMDMIELGDRFFAQSDEAYAIEKRIAKANGVNPALTHWKWYHPTA